MLSIMTMRVRLSVSDAGWIQLRLRSQCDDRRVKDTPQSLLQPAETDHPHMDPGLCVPELSGTVGSFKKQRKQHHEQNKEEKTG